MDDKQGPRLLQGDQPASESVAKLTADSLAGGSPEIGSPAIGQQHDIAAESLMTSAPTFREADQTHHDLRVAKYPTRKTPARLEYRQAEIHPVLAKRWPGRIPSELSDIDYLTQARAALKADRGTKGLRVESMRKTLLRYRKAHSKN